jgi:uncharacterized membrane protein
VNLVIGAVLGLATTVAVTRQFWYATIVLGTIGVAVSLTAWYGRRRAASDLTRINALEAADERETEIVVRGLAGVGAAALILAAAAVVVDLLLDDRACWTYYPLTGLCIAWAVSNWLARRRG